MMMKTYEEIKSEFDAKNYSKKELAKTIAGFKIVRPFFTKGFLFAVSVIPFAIGFAAHAFFYGYSAIAAVVFLAAHLAFYVKYVKKEHKKEIDPSLKELDLIIKALNDLKSEK